MATACLPGQVIRCVALCQVTVVETQLRARALCKTFCLSTTTVSMQREAPGYHALHERPPQQQVATATPPHCNVSNRLLTWTIRERTRLQR